ncbi:MAG: MgtC/SapB family protein [Clostridia bacterium]|nr:MgtC/SapB family protein [Clostridia bacterium]
MFQFSDPIARLLGAWSSEICLGSVIFRIALALIAGACIGCERATKRHAAGLRTFMLAVVATCIAMMLDIGFGAAPIVSAAAVVGLAIVSSNSVLFSSRSQIKGLTTSTGLWSCGIAGLAIGSGLYTLAIAACIAILATLSLFPSFEKYLKDRSNHFEIHLELKDRSNLQDFVTTIRRLGLRIDDIESNPAYASSGLSVYSVSVTITSAELKKYKRHDEIIAALRSLDYVYFIDEL